VRKGVVFSWQKGLLDCIRRYENPYQKPKDRAHGYAPGNIVLLKQSDLGGFTCLSLIRNVVLYLRETSSLSYRG
jgi:hypothetical protein